MFEDEEWDEGEDLSLPSGGRFDELLKKDFIALAKKSKISKATAQKLLEFAETRLIAHLRDEFIGSQDREHGGWAEVSEREFGKNKAEILAKAEQGLKSVDKDGSLAEDLQRTGLGNKHSWILLFAGLAGNSRSGASEPSKAPTSAGSKKPSWSGSSAPADAYPSMKGSR